MGSRWAGGRRSSPTSASSAVREAGSEAGFQIRTSNGSFLAHPWCKTSSSVLRLSLGVVGRHSRSRLLQAEPDNWVGEPVAGSRQCTVCPPNSSVIALQLRQHGRRASSSYVLAASLQVWNGMMVLLAAARFGPRRNASDPPRLLHLQRTRQLQLSKCMILRFIHHRVTCANPARRKGLSSVLLPLRR
jgi:hypothetical protein